MALSRFAAAFLCAVSAGAATVPAGAQVQVRLQTKLSSASSRANDPVDAVLIQPVADSNRIILPAGLVLHGVVKEAVPIKTPQDRAALTLEFTNPIAAKVAGVDNARESVADGRIVGILASETLAARINQGVGRVSEKHSGLGGFLGVVSSAVLKEPQPEIVYEPGIELTLVLTKPYECPSAPSSAPAVPAAVSPEAALYDFVNSQPFRSATEGQGIPSDLTNLMFLGTQAQLEAAFAAAGWSSAARLGAVSGLGVFQAVAESRGYKEAPMSILLLDGKRPDAVFQKQNNTFEKRHHLRIWRRPADFQGTPVWVCAATHDIGIEFSPEKRTFIHKIDSNIDAERAKVVSDLLFSGHVAALSLVTRPSAPTNAQNATGDKLETDGAQAVLLLQ
jgi:hypothetical protein